MTELSFYTIDQTATQEQGTWGLGKHCSLPVVFSTNSNSTQSAAVGTSGQNTSYQHKTEF